MTNTNKRELLVWEGGNKGCMAFRKAGEKGLPAHHTRATVAECKRAMEETAAKAGVARVDWQYVESLCSDRQISGWFAEIDLGAARA